MATQASIALTNRALRTIRTVCFISDVIHFTSSGLTLLSQELEFLTDSAVITPQQLSSILGQLPAQTPLHAPLLAPLETDVHTPADQFSSLSLKEHYAPVPTPAPLPPPAYASTPQVLSLASALYAYSPTDAGDLALQQNDRIQVLEHMNNDCMQDLPKLSLHNGTNYTDRVAWSKWKDWIGGYLPKKLCHHCRRETTHSTTSTKLDRLWQHAIGYESNRVNTKPRRSQTQQIGGTGQEIRQEDGQCCNFRRRCNDRQQHCQRHILMTKFACFYTSANTRLRLRFGYSFAAADAYTSLFPMSEVD